jgi:hypothetical protein
MSDSDFILLLKRFVLFAQGEEYTAYRGGAEEAQVFVERLRKENNRVRLHNSLGY